MSNWFSGRHLPGRFQVVFPTYAFLECQETAFLNLLCRRASSSDNISRLRVEGCCVVSSLRSWGKKHGTQKEPNQKQGTRKKWMVQKRVWEFSEVLWNFNIFFLIGSLFMSKFSGMQQMYRLPSPFWKSAKNNSAIYHGSQNLFES